jgi:tRNA dimethylallyltransferase
MKQIIVICGPTGIGKTSFAISLANAFNGEIIGADSQQIYKYLDIGTAKPDKGEREQAPHHLIDFVDPGDNYDAGKFVTDADRTIEQVFSKGRLPIVAGGTGLYIRALLHGLFRTRPACEKILDELNAFLKENGSKVLHQRLQACDPKAAQKIHPNDSFRVIRALEVYYSSGKTISERQKDHGFAAERYASVKIGLTMDREKLYKRINHRVDLMLEQGLLNEVKALVNQGFSLDLKSMQSIGYKQMGLYIKGEVDWPEAVRLLKRDTRRYAKRQFTWFKKEPDMIWVEPHEVSRAAHHVKEFLT